MAILLPFCLYARNGFDFDVQSEIYKNSEDVTAGKNRKDVVFIGVGRSPTGVIANLQNQGWQAYNFPLSQFGNWYGEGARWEDRGNRRLTTSEEALYSLFDKLIPQAIYQKKKIVLIDFAHTGNTLLNFTLSLKKYARVRNFSLPALESIFLNEPIDSVKESMRGESLDYSIKEVSHDMARIMGADGFAPYSEFGSLMIKDGRVLYWPTGNDSDKAILLKASDIPQVRSEFRAFRDLLKIGQVPGGNIWTQRKAACGSALQSFPLRLLIQ